ncbi:MAG: hypothetical protein V5A22_13735, partial [Salinivenus sp.]
MRLVRWLHSQVGLILVLGLLSWGLTGCYTQLQMTGEDPAAEASAEQTARTQGTPFDPAAPVASLRRANPDSREDLVSLAKALQPARADTEISFNEYRDGVRFFRTNYPAFYGNFFGDPFYATYDVQYQRTARAAWLVGLDINPHHGFRSMTGFLCAPHGYDPAFGCRSWAYRPSDFFSLPSIFALSGLESARYANRFLWSPFYRSPYYGFRGGWGLGARSLYGFRPPYGYRGLYGYGSGLSTTGAADGSDISAGDRRENRPRRGTVGRGATSAGAGSNADRSRSSGARADRGRFAEGRSGQRAEERERPSRSGSTASDDRDRSSASGMRGDAIRRPQMLIAPVFSGDDETGALGSVEDVGLETVRVSPPPMDDRSRTDALRTYRALLRIAETTDGRSVSITHRDEMASTVRHHTRMRDAHRPGRGRAGEYGGDADRRTPGARRGGSETSGASGRSRAGRGGRSNDGGSGSASGRSRSGRSDGGDSGRDRSRGGSG